MNIIEALEKKRDDFYKIRDISIQQEELLSNEELDEFLSLWEKRELIRKEIDSDQKKYRSALERADKKEREMAVSLNREISEVIESIMAVDKRVEELVREKREVFLCDIKGLKKGRTAVKSYGNKKGLAYSRFIKTIG
ncbi:MAG: hypothetical protein JW927_11550 [Deltaproteobacteria bacterium]|nr:hypothetical protein [Deltaproteobacteria bacterium]